MSSFFSSIYEILTFHTFISCPYFICIILQKKLTKRSGDICTLLSIKVAYTARGRVNFSNTIVKHGVYVISGLPNGFK